MNRLHQLARRARRAVLLRRRPLAALLTAAAVLVGLEAVSPAPAETRTVVVAARDLPGGAVLAHSDLARAELPPETVPRGVVTASRAVGRTTAAPVRAGEPLTDVRLVGGDLLAGYPARVAAPVRIADAGAVRLLRVGDLVDVLAADPQGHAGATVVAARAPVVALPRGGGNALASGGLVVLAVDEDTAAGLATAGVTRYLSLVITH